MKEELPQPGGVRVCDVVVVDGVFGLGQLLEYGVFGGLVGALLTAGDVLPCVCVVLEKFLVGVVVEPL